MMNELDKKVLELFRFLLNSGTKYLTNIDYIRKSLEYRISNKSIKLGFYRKHSEEGEASPNSYTTVEKMARSMEFIPYSGPIRLVRDEEKEIRYYITVNEKYYDVPKLSRMEQAQALDRVDAILEEKESEDLDSVLNEFTADSREEL